MITTTSSLSRSDIRLPLLVGLFLCPLLLAAQFTGGNGDGHDVQNLLVQLNGYDATGLFAGGDGDGHDAQTLFVQLSGYNATGLFAGGDGDGHDAQALLVQLGGYDATGLFAGGDGDGHDAQALLVQLSGYDATGLFAGGDGDGHDMGEFVGGLLPLTLISFEAIPQAKYVLLKWVTADEQDTDYFTIEKTRDGSSFTSVGAPLTAAGFTDPGEQLHYELRDELPWTGTSFYRLKTTDFDGSFLLSALQEVHYSSATDWDFTLFPNPNDGRRLSVRMEAAPAQELELQIFTVEGKRVLQQTLPAADNGDIRLNLSGNRLLPGTYVIHLDDADGERKSKVLVVAARH